MLGVSSTLRWLTKLVWGLKMALFHSIKTSMTIIVMGACTWSAWHNQQHTMQCRHNVERPNRSRPWQKWALQDKRGPNSTGGTGVFASRRARPDSHCDFERHGPKRRRYGHDWGCPCRRRGFSRDTQQQRALESLYPYSHPLLVLVPDLVCAFVAPPLRYLSFRGGLE